MTEQNTPDNDRIEEDIEEIRVEFESAGEGVIIYGSQVFGLTPGMTLSTDIDEETEAITFNIKVYGTDQPADFLEGIIGILENIKDTVALEAERVALEREREEDELVSPEDE